MEFLIRSFVAPFGEIYFQKALIGGSIAAVVCSVVGCLVILRGMAFLGDALSHAMIAGVAGGYLFMKVFFDVEAHAPSMLIGSLIAAIITVASIGFVSSVSRIKRDTAIGIMYTGVFAAGVVLVSIFRNYIHIDLMHFIMGDVLGVADSDLWVAVIAACLVLSLIILFFRQFQITSFDPVMAAAIGAPVILVDYALTTCVSLVVVSAVSMVGVILVVGLLITPAATAYLLSDRLDRMMWLAAFFGVTSVLGGLYLCVWLDSSGGGAIMLFCTFQFLGVLILAPRYGLLAGWMRRRRITPQELQEDILGALVRRKGEPLSVSKIAPIAKRSRKEINKAIKNMRKDGLLSSENGTIRLTESGEREATRVLRAHRLWEAYLSHTGAADDELHNKAHELEHFHDADAVDYIDDLLGHPITDPHGSTIPQDHGQCAPGSVCKLSMLRRGARGKVNSQERMDNFPLDMGEEIQIGPRQNDGGTWTVIRADGAPITLEHEEADSVEVLVLD
jgi:manganese/iron transport system permease protein/iron/zinc/copper transport system permease protein